MLDLSFPDQEFGPFCGIWDNYHENLFRYLTKGKTIRNISLFFFVKSGDDVISENFSSFGREK